MKKTTPGPWRCIIREDQEPLIKAKQVRIAEILYDKHQTEETLEANGHLVAAAPDMLEALEAIKRRFNACAEYGDDVDEYVIEDLTEVINKALAKARGK